VVLYLKSPAFGEPGLWAVVPAAHGTAPESPLKSIKLLGTFVIAIYYCVITTSMPFVAVTGGGVTNVRDVPDTV